MLICIDGRMLDQPATGVARYARSLVDVLRGEGADPLILGDGGVQLRRSRAAGFFSALRPGRRFLVRNEDGFCARDIFREAQARFTLSGRLLELVAPGPAGVMHWTYPLPMFLRGWRNVYTVHDVIPLDPDIPTSVDSRRLGRILDLIATVADRIVTVSDTAKADIARRMSVPPAQVVNLSQSVDLSRPATPDLPESLEAGRYFLHIGMIEPRKNVERLVAAYRASGVRHPLLLVGPESPGRTALKALTVDDDRLRWLPYQPRDVLIQLMAGARALLFPSLAEGFGLPVVEAMALGVPVLTASGGALEEVSGNAALLVPPTDIEAMAAAIRALDADDALRDRLIAAGLTRAGHFAPRPYARRLIDLYQGLA